LTFEEIIEKFQARRVGSSWMARCPAHEDSNPSLSIDDGDKGILLHCHAGCNVRDILGAAGLTFEDIRRNGTDPKRDETKARAIPENIKAIYDYTDEQGNVLFQTVRYEEAGKEKTFRQRRPDGHGGWIWNLDGVRLVLYNLPEVLKADAVLICEGEKDCETAKKLGLVATCNPMGAGKWKPSYNVPLIGKDCTVIPDGDQPGIKHGEQIATELYEVAKPLAVCRLPERIKDLTQYVECGLSKESLLELIKQAPAWKPAEERAGEKLGSCSVAELYSAHEKQIDWLCWPFAGCGLATILDALPKTGKTIFILRGIRASLDGKPFLNLPTKKMHTVYVSEQSRRRSPCRCAKLGSPAKSRSKTCALSAARIGAASPTRTCLASLKKKFSKPVVTTRWSWIRSTPSAACKMRKTQAK
jgi:putative DNA primase/helicase